MNILKKEEEKNVETVVKMILICIFIASETKKTALFFSFILLLPALHLLGKD